MLFPFCLFSFILGEYFLGYVASLSFFLQRILIRKRGSILFQALRAHPPRIFLLGVILFFLSLLRERFAASIPFWIFFFFSLSLLLSSSTEDRRNDPLMENATAKNERLLSLTTRTSSPATPSPLLPYLLHRSPPPPHLYLPLTPCLSSITSRPFAVPLFSERRILLVF